MSDPYAVQWKSKNVTTQFVENIFKLLPLEIPPKYSFSVLTVLSHFVSKNQYFEFN